MFNTGFRSDFVFPLVVLSILYSDCWTNPGELNLILSAEYESEYSYLNYRDKKTKWILYILPFFNDL